MLAGVRSSKPWRPNHRNCRYIRLRDQFKVCIIHVEKCFQINDDNFSNAYLYNFPISIDCDAMAELYYASYSIW
jgi:hypothetical protein